jgi:DNA-binding NtrC family response regulator
MTSNAQGVSAAREWSLLGSSEPMRQLRDVIERVAGSERPVLVTGQTGTGKELVVREIHMRSRHPEPLIDLNCGAFPESLMEAQLFGHEKGAFTGAQQTHEGFLATVGRGTLFLDEIGELPLALQAKLLRVLEARSYRPLGSSSLRNLTGRVIAATHVDLQQRVADGEFRQDLLYRLNVLEVRTPALEERREDIPELALHFAQHAVRKLSFTPAALAILQNAAWPGNIRQLRNLIDRLDVFALDRLVDADTLRSVLEPSSRQVRRAQTVSGLVQAVLNSQEGDKFRAIEQALLTEALKLADGNKTAAARILGCHRKIVERRLERSKKESEEDACGVASDPLDERVSKRGGAI